MKNSDYWALMAGIYIAPTFAEWLGLTLSLLCMLASWLAHKDENRGD